MSINPLNVIRQDVQSMHAYAVQDAAGMVKLDAMENPYALPPELQVALGARLGAVAVNRYPGPRVEDLKAALLVFRQVARAWLDNTPSPGPTSEGDGRPPGLASLPAPRRI